MAIQDIWSLVSQDCQYESPKSDIMQIWDQLPLLIKSHKLSYSILHEFQSHLYPVSTQDTDLQREALNPSAITSSRQSTPEISSNPMNGPTPVI